MWVRQREWVRQIEWVRQREWVRQIEWVKQREIACYDAQTNIMQNTCTFEFVLNMHMRIYVALSSRIDQWACPRLRTTFSHVEWPQFLISIVQYHFASLRMRPRELVYAWSVSVMTACLSFAIQDFWSDACSAVSNWVWLCNCCFSVCEWAHIFCSDTVRSSML